MSEFANFLRQLSEYGFPPMLIAAAGVAWLLWRFPSARRILFGQATAQAAATGSTGVVMRDDCHRAMAAVETGIRESGAALRAEMHEGFDKVHQRIDKVFEIGAVR